MESVNGWWITGITDGEGYFTAGTFEDNRYGNKRRQIHMAFGLSLRADDAEAIKKIIDYFGTGTVQIDRARNWCPMARFKIYNKPGLARVIEHFDKFPLQSKKLRDYNLWRKAFKMYALRRKGDGVVDFEKLAEKIRRTRDYKDGEWRGVIKSMLPSGKVTWRSHKKKQCSTVGCSGKAIGLGLCLRCWKKDYKREKQELDWSL